MLSYRILELDGKFQAQYELNGNWMPIEGFYPLKENAQKVIDKHAKSTVGLNEVIHKYSPNTKQILLG